MCPCVWSAWVPFGSGCEGVFRGCVPRPFEAAADDVSEGGGRPEEPAGRAPFLPSFLLIRLQPKPSGKNPRQPSATQRSGSLWLVFCATCGFDHSASLGTLRLPKSG